MKIAASFLENDPRWRAVQSRDRAFDGRFFYAVRSTGIYCRPSCPARRPAPGNVAFYASAHAAAHAGFRACRKCFPDRPETWNQDVQVIAEVRRMIETSDTVPDLCTIARKAGFSPFYFHRLFKTQTGMTPRQYALKHRAGESRP